MGKNFTKSVIIFAVSTVFCNSIFAAQVRYGKFAFHDKIQQNEQCAD
jgi:hypothetical protein